MNVRQLIEILKHASPEAVIVVPSRAQDGADSGRLSEAQESILSESA